MALFQSRKVLVLCGAEDFFNFVTDIRNFGRFIPAGMKDGWSASSESCVFTVPGLGTVNLSHKKMQPYTKVLFSGDAVSRIKFILETDIEEKDANNCSVVLSLSTETDALTGMIISPAITRFLEMVSDEMEKFTGWKEKPF